MNILLELLIKKIYLIFQEINYVNKYEILEN